MDNFPQIFHQKNVVFQTLLMMLPTLITKFKCDILLGFPAICTIQKKIKQKVLLDPAVVLFFILQTAKWAQREAPLETVS